ncbi:MAG: hypothetical protein AB1742_07655 [bacterium]
MMHAVQYIVLGVANAPEHANSAAAPAKIPAIKTLFIASNKRAPASKTLPGERPVIMPFFTVSAPPWFLNSIPAAKHFLIGLHLLMFLNSIPAQTVRGIVLIFVCPAPPWFLTITHRAALLRLSAAPRDICTCMTSVRDPVLSKKGRKRTKVGWF